jgi:hypothetical protein
MRTRKNAIQPDHVNALNLVEIEFHNSGPVLAAYRDLSVLPARAAMAIVTQH